jgi:hypothetical protein
MVLDSMSTILQAAIAPTVLISGIGLLLLSMTNRYARPLDRLGSVPNYTKMYTIVKSSISLS